MASRRHHRRQQEDERARLLTEILQSHRDVLLRTARLNSRLSQDAEDALGDACEQFLLHFEGESVAEGRYWMLFVVKRCAWAIPRRRRQRSAVAEEVLVDPMRIDSAPAFGDDRLDPARLVDAVGDLAAALARLKSDDGRALLLLTAGYKLSEIASIQGWTYTKVKRCVYEGRRRLRADLGEGGEES